MQRTVEFQNIKSKNYAQIKLRDNIIYEIDHYFQTSRIFISTTYNYF